MNLLTNINSELIIIILNYHIKLKILVPIILEVLSILL